MYCIARSFVVERYGTNNEDFRELYRNCIKNDKIVEFFDYFKVNFKHFWIVCCRKLRDNNFLIV